MPIVPLLALAPLPIAARRYRVHAHEHLRAERSDLHPASLWDALDTHHALLAADGRVLGWEQTTAAQHLMATLARGEEFSPLDRQLAAAQHIALPEAAVLTVEADGVVHMFDRAAWSARTDGADLLLEGLPGTYTEGRSGVVHLSAPEDMERAQRWVASDGVPI